MEADQGIKAYGPGYARRANRFVATRAPPNKALRQVRSLYFPSKNEIVFIIAPNK